MLITVSRRAKKQLDKIPDKIFEHILSKITGLTKDSPNLDLRKLNNREGIRLRVGDYRVIYTINSKELTILSVAHRKDAYRH